MTGLIVRHFWFWRREIPVDRVWTDRVFGDQFEVKADGGLRFIKASSVLAQPVSEPLSSVAQGVV